ncbi:MAG: hypothetical protein ACFFG0_12540 [Candidatus Thorarchaeota archaeon]
MFKNLKNSIKEPLIIYTTGILITILSIIFFTIRGYPLVVTASETLDIITPPIYMISIFLPYGILVGEVVWMWNVRGESKLYILLLLESIIVAIISFTRYIIKIPLSGHAIIILFYLLHQTINNRSQKPLRILIGIIVLMITLIYKVFFWDDPITFIFGAVLGIILWIPGFLYRHKKGK